MDAEQSIKKITEILALDYPFIPDCFGNFDAEGCWRCQNWMECSKGEQRTRLLAELGVITGVEFKPVTQPKLKCIDK